MAVGDPPHLTPWAALPPVAWSFSPARLNAVGAGPAARRGRAEPACTTWSEKTQVAGTRNRASGSSPSRRGTLACPQPDPRRGQLPNPGTPGTSRSKNPTSQAVRNGTRNSLAPLDKLLLTLVSSGGITGLLSVFPVVGGMLDWPAGLVWPTWGCGLPCSQAAAGPGERLVGVKDRAEPGRRSRRRQASLTPRAVSAPGCGHPSGWPAAAGRGAWGWSARAAGSIRAAAAARGGARHGSDHALPAAGPAHPASCSAAGVSSALTCPSRIA